MFLLLRNVLSLNSFHGSITHSIYLHRHSYNEKKNLENVSKALEIIEIFFIWSGLKINGGKTYLSIFGQNLEKPRFVQELGIKLCTEFTLFRIKFDQTLICTCHQADE